MTDQGGIHTRLKNLLLDCDDEILEPMRQYFTGEPTREKTTQGIVRLLCACGYGTLAPRENQPWALDTFLVCVHGNNLP